ncbi:hypothetical protein K8R03_03895 [Candidatus Kaiserbacteria bacterium]|nr:hypothetical protein [Candidatus Kaiserbacteria bacterium]
MLSLFPQLLFLAPFSALIIRLALFAFLAYTAWKHVSRRDSFLGTWSIVEIGVAAALGIGLWVQVAALAALVLVLLALFVPSMRILPSSTLLLMCVLSLSLFVTGAGAFAFDLPL